MRLDYARSVDLRKCLFKAGKYEACSQGYEAEGSAIRTMCPDRFLSALPL
jgi:hypothetical protein